MTYMTVKEYRAAVNQTAEHFTVSNINKLNGSKFIS